MKLLFIVPRFHINLSYQVEALQESGHEVSLAVLYRGGSENTNALEPTVIGSRIAPKTLPSLIKLFKVISKTQPDVICVRGYKSWFTLIAMLTVRLSGRRLMLLVQTDKHDGFGLYRRTALWILSRLLRVERVISPLQNSRPTMHKLYTYAPFVITPSPCTAAHVSKQVTRIITVGKFQARKGHLLLLSVCKKLIEEGSNIELTIVGETYDALEEERIRSFIKQHYLEDRVTILSHLSHEAVRSLYCDHDIFVLPSWNEPAAFSPLEAMSAGLPAVVSDTCGTKCYVKEGVSGYIFKSRNEDDLHEKVKQVLADNPKKLGKQALHLIQEHNSAERYAHIITNIIEPKV